MKTTYLIPMVTNGETLVLEYKVETCKKDMRLKFCKKNEKYEVNPSTLIRLIGEFKLIIKYNRVIMPNGKTAYLFGKKIGIKIDKHNW